MDVDVECFDATDKMIDGFDLVLQLEDSGNKSLNNAVMAGAPGLEIWAIMQSLLQQRCAPIQPLAKDANAALDKYSSLLQRTLLLFSRPRRLSGSACTPL